MYVSNQNIIFEFNPYFPSGISILIISNLWGVLCTFLYFIFDRNSCKQTVSTLIRIRVLRCLIRVYTVCLGLQLWDARHTWVKLYKTQNSQTSSKLFCFKNVYTQNVYKISTNFHVIQHQMDALELFLSLNSSSNTLLKACLST